jgi:hypothetical protein
MEGINYMQFVSSKQGKEIEQYKNVKDSSYTKLAQQYGPAKCVGSCS